MMEQDILTQLYFGKRVESCWHNCCATAPIWRPAPCAMDSRTATGLVPS